MNRTPYIPTARDRAKAAQVAQFGVRRTDKPEPGFYAYRFVKGAPEVGARILHEPTRDPDTGDLLDRSFWWTVTINGKPDINPGLEPSDTVWNVYIYGRRIAEPEYRFLVADREWAAEHRPELPEANPRERVDLLTTPLPF